MRWTAVAWIDPGDTRGKVLVANHIGLTPITILAISALTINISNVNVKIRMMI
jgi:hypothetical protein